MAPNFQPTKAPTSAKAAGLSGGAIAGITLVVLIAAFGFGLAWRYHKQNKDLRHHSDLQMTDLNSYKLMGESAISAGSSTASKEPPWKLKYAELEVGAVIGAGSFGRVFKGTHNHQEVAIKQIVLSIDSEERDAQLSSATQEMYLLWDLKHPNILKFIGVAVVRERGQEFMSLVTELCIGSLDVYTSGERKQREAIENGMPELTDDLVLNFVLGIAAGLAFIHNKPAVHRDLKPGNVFLGSDNRIRIGDFGLSRMMNMDSAAMTLQQMTATANVGTPGE
jgi:serine/threonine protein kinase